MTTTARLPSLHVEQLVAGSRRGDTFAFDQLVRLYKDKVCAFVARRLSDPVEAEDIVQEAFVKAYRHLPSFRGASSFQTWLHCIAGNLALDTLRQRRRRGSHCSLDAPLEVDDGALEYEPAAPSNCEPDQDLETAELQREMHRAIRELPPKLRAVVVLYDLQGLNYQQIATTLGCPLGTVKSRMFNARGQLKRNLLRSHTGLFPASSGGERDPSVLACV
jgi:RNA polymerase sigma-70 factor, ECF subfamily